MPTRRDSLLALAASLIAAALFSFNYVAAAAATMCTPPSGVATHRFPDDLPTALKQALDESGPIAAPEEAFCATDVCNGGPRSRMIFVWSHDNRWVLTIEQGGIAYRIAVLAYDLATNGTAQVVKLPPSQQADKVCDIAERALTAP